MSMVYKLGPYWTGYSGIKQLVVFGDSYSYVGYHSQAPPPTAARPLGLPYPGTPVNEPGHANWVGHLITTYGHGHSNILAYDYAIRGDTVQGVRTQVANQFVPTVGRKPQWARWSSKDTLFVTWAGVNDCRLLMNPNATQIAAIIANLFAAQEQLYQTGARNFLFIDLPPVHRSPAGLNAVGDYAWRYMAFNDELRRAIQLFSARHTDATVILFSSWSSFSRVLDNPTPYGFPAGDVYLTGGSIWFDYMHPTSRMHHILAREIAHLLNSQ